jgi:dipeptidyl aminopeptidase/acylaminoacyl peptidase
MIKIKIVHYLLILQALISITAQAQKRKLTPDDYKLWSTLRTGKFTDNGDWTTYTISHTDGKDTLYLKSTLNDLKYSFPLGHNESFSADSNWFAYIKQDTLKLLNLKSGYKRNFPSITQGTFTAESRYLLMGNKKAGTLCLQNLAKRKNLDIENVKEYSLNPDGTLLAFISAEDKMKSVKTISLTANLKTATLASNNQNLYSGLTWDKYGKTLAFLEETKEKILESFNHKVFFCKNINTKPQITILDPQLTPAFAETNWIPFSRLLISDDSKQLFFDSSSRPKAIKAKSAELVEVQIWNTNDKQVPPPKKEIKPDGIENTWSVWWPETNTIIPVVEKQYPHVVLTVDQKNALVYNTDGYLPQFEYVGKYIDIYIKDLKTGTKKLIIKKAVNDLGHVLVSPAGKYVSYFKDSSWWIFDIAKNKSICVTAALDVPFYDVDYDQAGAKPAYGNPGWTNDDENLLLYDQFDIWLIAPDGKTRKRITNGRDKKKAYRIHEEPKIIFRSTFAGNIAVKYDNEKGVILHILDTDTREASYALWTEKSGIEELISKDSKLSGIRKAKNNKSYLFLESSFNVSPKLIYLSETGRQKVIGQANQQQKEFFWGKSELITYKSQEGKPLKAALFYPADYSPEKKYPMIVYIYQKKANEVYNYVNPTLRLSTGFSVTNFTAEGYFVLLPDFAYQLNETGNSALECVKAVTEQALINKSIDRSNIGLMGHSFGGFETTYIISQTNMFKTAVAGAPVTDLLSSYLTLDGTNISNINRYENSQFRIQTPFYEKGFLKNSPIMNVQNINTPLLLFTGNQDITVDWSNSMKMQIALWRLKKKSTLLVYPGEDHAFVKESNQKDLYFKVKAWFDYYLKNGIAEDWMQLN